MAERHFCMFLKGKKKIFFLIFLKKKTTLAVEGVIHLEREKLRDKETRPQSDCRNAPKNGKDLSKDRGNRDRKKKGNMRIIFLKLNDG